MFCWDQLKRKSRFEFIEKAQQPDLKRPVAALAGLYPQAEIISEVGGGLNFKRKKLLSLLERILKGDVRLVRNIRENVA